MKNFLSKKNESFRSTRDVKKIQTSFIKQKYWYHERRKKHEVNNKYSESNFVWNKKIRNKKNKILKLIYFWIARALAEREKYYEWLDVGDEFIYTFICGWNKILRRKFAVDGRQFGNCCGDQHDEWADARLLYWSFDWPNQFFFSSSIKRY